MFIGGDYARKFGLVQGLSLKNCASDSGIEGSVGDRIREERVRLNLSQEDLAQAGGVNRNTQGTYERGGRNPDTSYLEGVAALGVDTVYVLSGQRLLSTGLSNLEAKLVEQFRSIPDDDQRTIVRILRAMVDDVARHSK